MKNMLTVLLLAITMVFGTANAAAVKNAKTASGYTGKIESVEVTYDYSKDAGAIGALDLLTAGQDLVIHRVIAKVKSAVVGTTSTVAVGISSGDSVAFMAEIPEASLTSGAVIDSKKGGVKLASGGKMIQTIKAGTVTAGKVTYLIEYSKF